MRMHKESKQGSALLLTLLITSLLIMIVLSFTVYVRMELRGVQNRMHHLQAKQNAKLAMHLALNKLQTAAGPDQRVTARADITGATAGATFWTGVWENDGAGGVKANPVWLVSGQNPSPNTPGTFEIFPPINSDPAVTVEPEDVTDNDGKTIGNIAYWISDEGTKASLMARRHGIELYQDPSLNPSRSFVEYQSDFGVDLGTFFANPSVDLTDGVFASVLERTNSLKDVPMISDSSSASLTLLDSDPPYHDLTLLSLGVLENPQSGGLKKNLSAMAPAPAGSSFRDNFLATNETWEFLDPNKPTELQIEYGNPPPDIQKGDPYFSPRPILTEAALYMGLYHFSRRIDINGKRSDGKIRTRYHVEAEILNPYSLPLNLDIGQYGPMTLLVRNLPTVTVTDLSGKAPSVSIDLDLAFNDFSPRRSIDVGYFSALEYKENGSPYLLPGEVFQSKGPGQSQGLARNISDQIWSGANEPLDDARIRITGVHGNEPLIFELVHHSYSYRPTERNAPRIQTISLSRSSFPYTDFDIEKTFNDPNNPFTRFGSSGSYEDETERNMAYHFRLWSDDTDPMSMRDLLTRVPILSHKYEMSGEFENIDGDLVDYNTIMIPDELNPTLSARSINAFDLQDVFMDQTRNLHTNGFRKMILVDVPTDDVLSVGLLHSLPLYLEPIGIIGSPWGGNYNDAFDLYFFSPKREHPDTGTPLMLSPALIHWNGSGIPADTLESVPDANDAEHEMVVGQFNMNSTSTAAWQAVLSAPVLIGGNGVQGAFFRMPLEVAKSGNSAQTLADSQLADNAFRLGGRALQPDIANSILRDLSQDIVSRLISHGSPFSNLKEFINSGILQDAIDTVEGNYASGAQKINEGVLSFSNLYLTQNDLLIRLAPMISPRSDTFVIRTYGDVQGLTGETLAKAGCEAVVQRVPAKLDGSSPAAPADSLLDSRSFRIVSFRWLTDEDS